jgi:hypothetical protein
MKGVKQSTTENNVKYLGVIFDKKVTWRLHIEMIEAKAFRTFIRIYSLFRSQRLNTNIKLTLHKAFIRGTMTYACPAWEFAADNHPLKLQRMQSKVLRTTGNYPRHTGSRGSRDSSVGIATGYGLDDQRGRVKNFHFSISSRPALGSTQPLIKSVPGALSRG